MSNEIHARVKANFESNSIACQLFTPDKTTDFVNYSSREKWVCCDEKCEMCHYFQRLIEYPQCESCNMFLISIFFSKGKDFAT